MLLSLPHILNRAAAHLQLAAYVVFLPLGECSSVRRELGDKLKEREKAVSLSPLRPFCAIRGVKLEAIVELKQSFKQRED